jgi:hypothetical protein
MKRTVLWCVLASSVLGVPSVALAGVCVSGPVSGLLGKTCTIGDKSFSFASFNGTRITAAQVQLTVDASNPLAPGFVLSGLSGPITLSTANSQLQAQLNFTVSTTSGAPIMLGTTVTLANPTAAGNGSNIVDAFDFIANGSDSATVGHPGPLPEVCIDIHPQGGSACVGPPFPATLSATGTFTMPESTTTFGQAGFELLTTSGTATFTSAGYKFNQSAASTAGTSFAVVNMDGSLASGSRDVQGTTYIGTGQYEVTFANDVSNCAYVATTINAYSQALQVFTAGGHLSSQGVYVETKNQGGGLTDGPFNLVVVCGSAVTQYAVVDYSANLVRSSPGTTLTPLGSGRYNVSFPSSVGACAYIATVADPGNGLVSNPSGVYTASGGGAGMVYIETKNTGGGLQDGVPFHLAVICPNPAQSSVIVVMPNGFPKRGSPLTSSFNASTGEYTVVTNADITACATVATRGSVDTSAPFAPATLEIVGGPANNTIGIEERNLLSFGGDLLNEAFHAAIVCGAGSSSFSASGTIGKGAAAIRR